MSESPDTLAQQIAALEAALQLSLPEESRQQLQDKLRALQAAVAPTGDAIAGDKVASDKIVDSQGTVNVSDDARVAGVVVGVNTGTVQAFFGAQPPADAKELLDSYLETLVAEYGPLRLGKLLGKEQTGREQAILPTLSLRAIYTALATNVRLPLKSFTDLDRKAVMETMDAGNPDLVLPDLVRLPVLRAVDRHPELVLATDTPSAPMLSGEDLVSQWATLRRAVQSAPDQPLSGRWYRPELPINAIGAHRRLVLLGSPGSGKSTAALSDHLAG